MTPVGAAAAVGVVSAHVTCHLQVQCDTNCGNGSICKPPWWEVERGVVFHGFHSSVNPSMTLGLKFQLLPRTDGFYVFAVLLNAFKKYGAPRPAASEELKVRAVHRGRY